MVGIDERNPEVIVGIGCSILILPVEVVPVYRSLTVDVVDYIIQVAIVIKVCECGAIGKRGFVKFGMLTTGIESLSRARVAILPTAER
jgi:hypothetical protein